MKENIKISVVIPVYNVEKYVEQCIESVITQTLKEIEIIIVNDASTDSSLEKIKNYLYDKRIKLINKNKNEGLSAARNTGIKEAKGEYIFNLDSDDFIKYNTLEKCYILAKEKKAEVIIFDSNIYLDEKKIVEKIIQETTFEEGIIYTGKDYLIQHFLGKTFSVVWNKLWKRDLYVKNNIYFPENITYGEDSATVARLMANVQRIYKINENFIYYRQRKGSLMEKGINLENARLAYEIPLNFLKNKELDYLEKYEFSYKINHFYNCILKYKKNDKIFKEKEIYKKFYDEFITEIKNPSKKIFYYDKNLKTELKSILYNKIYKKSIILGEFFRARIIDINRVRTK